MKRVLKVIAGGLLWALALTLISWACLLIYTALGIVDVPPAPAPPALPAPAEEPVRLELRRIAGQLDRAACRCQPAAPCTCKAADRCACNRTGIEAALTKLSRELAQVIEFLSSNEFMVVPPQPPVRTKARPKAALRPCP